jgi:hypothetical protein
MDPLFGTQVESFNGLDKGSMHAVAELNTPFFSLRVCDFAFPGGPPPLRNRALALFFEP